MQENIPHLLDHKHVVYMLDALTLYKLVYVMVLLLYTVRSLHAEEFLGSLTQALFTGS